MEEILDYGWLIAIVQHSIYKMNNNFIVIFFKLMAA
jgi:hypothetical protein